MVGRIVVVHAMADWSSHPPNASFLGTQLELRTLSGPEQHAVQERLAGLCVPLSESTANARAAREALREAKVLQLQKRREAERKRKRAASELEERLAQRRARATEESTDENSELQRSNGDPLDDIKPKRRRIAKEDQPPAASGSASIPSLKENNCTTACAKVGDTTTKLSKPLCASNLGMPFCPSQSQQLVLQHDEQKLPAPREHRWSLSVCGQRFQAQKSNGLPTSLPLSGYPQKARVDSESSAQRVVSSDCFAKRILQSGCVVS